MTLSSPIRRASGLACAGLLGLGSLLAACGDDGESAPTTTSPEDVKVPMAEVLATMPEMLVAADAAEAAAADGDFELAGEHYDHLHGLWEEIEGTVKDTDAAHYEEIETAQSLIKDGAENKDADRVATGVADHAEAVNHFVEENG